LLPALARPRASAWPAALADRRCARRGARAGDGALR